MSIIVACGAQICNSMVNNSRSKQMFSFSKAERFPKTKIEELPKDENKRKLYKVSYVPNTKSQRFTTFGFGNRYDFTGGAMKRNKTDKDITKETPLKKEFDPKERIIIKDTPAYSFGVSRDRVIGGIFSQANMRIKADKDDNKDDDYKPKERKFGDDGIKYSFRGRNEGNADAKRRIAERERRGNETSQENVTTNEKRIYLDAYSMNNSGKYYLSQLSNVNSTNFVGNKDSKRFVYMCKFVYYNVITVYIYR